MHIHINIYMYMHAAYLDKRNVIQKASQQPDMILHSAGRSDFLGHVWTSKVSYWAAVRPLKRM